MNFDNCNYVLNNAGQLIRLLLSQANSEQMCDNDDCLTNENTLMGRENGSFENSLLNSFTIIVFFSLLYAFFTSILTRKNKQINQKPTPINKNDDNNLDQNEDNFTN